MKLPRMLISYVKLDHTQYQIKYGIRACQQCILRYGAGRSLKLIDMASITSGSRNGLSRGTEHHSQRFIQQQGTSWLVKVITQSIDNIDYVYVVYSIYAQSRNGSIQCFTRSPVKPIKQILMSNGQHQRQPCTIGTASNQMFGR